MYKRQQKQHHSEDQFESAPTEVETYTTPPQYHSPSPSTYHPRSRHLHQKQKLGLVIVPILTEPEYSPPPKKVSFPPHGKIIKIGNSTFRSNFQSGSIGTVDLIGNNSFKVSLDPETNSARCNSWFYFTVEGVKGQAQFLVKGFGKKSSLFNQGMKICYRDSKQPTKWRRGGTRISYQPYQQKQDEDRSYCLKFTYFFKTNQYSSIQFAYSFPYSYQKLNIFLTQIHQKIKFGSLGQSYEGRNVPLLTIGNQNSKELIVISARVHPGETGSSFIVEGFIRELVSDQPYAQYLRDKFLFKVIPMINVDGVCKGNYRFSGAGVDLNRKWKKPSQQSHPQIYYLKEMIRKESKERKLKMFIDIHGHSRKKNVFFYGCCPGDLDLQNCSKAKAFPFLMGKIHNAYNYQDCAFSVQKQKQGTARVALFKQFKINQIFTLEASFCGPDSGPNFTELQYQKLGRKLCEGISAYFYQPGEKTSTVLSKLADLRQNCLKQLKSSPFYLKLGNEQNSGSDSDPEKGETFQKVITRQHSKQSNSQKRVNNTSSNQNTRLMPKIYSSIKQKSQASILISQEKDNKDLCMYLVEAPSQLFDVDFRSKQQIINQRVHSVSKQTQYQNNKHRKSNPEDQVFRSLNPDKNQEKGKINLMMSREGAQYRRVRKVAEQSRRHDVTQPSVLPIRGIQGSRVEADHRNKMRKAALQERGKYRRTSAEMFFKKPVIFDERLEADKSQIKVLCRGKQIHF